MSSTAPVFEHKFPSGLGQTIAVLSVSFDDIAARFGEPLSWDDDGLGPARGVVVRLPSGRIVLIKELAFAIKYQGAPGPQLVVDGAALVAFGVDGLLQEALRALGISESAVAWKADEITRQSAARLLAAWCQPPP
jgi:hypothetical protein